MHKVNLNEKIAMQLKEIENKIKKDETLKKYLAQDTSDFDFVKDRDINDNDFIAYEIVDIYKKLLKFSQTHDIL